MMKRSANLSARVVALAAIAAGIGACSSETFSKLNLLPSSETMLARPDWVTFSGRRGAAELRAVTPEDLVAPGGVCAGTGPEPTAVAETSEAAPGGASAEGAGPPAAPLVAGGIALQMTECDVVRRAGQPDQADIGNDGGDRTVVLTFLRGPWPGIYRFTGGRLTSIERAPLPPAPAKPQKKKPAKAKSRGNA